MKRLCLFCEHFWFSEEERGYSEYTPGHPAHLECLKSKWSLDSIIDFRETMKMAETCKEFVVSSDAEELGFVEDFRSSSRVIK